MQYPHLKGKRYAAFARCSTKGQSDTSIGDQLALVKAFAAQHAMVHVRDIVLDGVTGSIPGRRTDIDDILQRQDFDVLVVQDATRLTRSGPEHGMKVMYDLAVAGIEVVFVADNVPEGEFAPVFRAMLFYSGNHTARLISHNGRRGAQSALESGRRVPGVHAPYGIDKLYSHPDGRPSHIIRTLSNGDQLRIDARTGKEVCVYGRTKEGRKLYYIKQKQEMVSFVPGDPERVAVVRRVFREYLLERKSIYRICRELNNEGIPAAEGGRWGASILYRMLHSPVYLGNSVANRFCCAVYNKASPVNPTPVKVDAHTLATTAL